ncbi:hypothetical protein JAAARDRAFT_48750 [Jaapia argillacea MUCL 33604]|uniref:DUF6697 domain-containing protein n=1 Tax=Jaapia argillacea MUCL 33604 TaxID=933084 RepID=A0A067PKD9_9AGAM|nr:hypothetical protein JAAARDRAFT_48750 [Jaapia argillacea MUCL 33604]
MPFSEPNLIETFALYAEALKATNTRLRQDRRSAKIALSSLEQHNEDLRHDLRTIGTENYNLGMEQHTLQQAFDALQAEAKTLISENVVMHQEKLDLSQALLALTDENNTLKKSGTSHEEEVNGNKKYSVPPLAQPLPRTTTATATATVTSVPSSQLHLASRPRTRSQAAMSKGSAIPTNSSLVHPPKPQHKTRSGPNLLASLPKESTVAFTRSSKRQRSVPDGYPGGSRLQTINTSTVSPSGPTSLVPSSRLPVAGLSQLGSTQPDWHSFQSPSRNTTVTPTTNDTTTPQRLDEKSRPPTRSTSAIPIPTANVSAMLPGSPHKRQRAVYHNRSDSEPTRLQLPTSMRSQYPGSSLVSSLQAPPRAAGRSAPSRPNTFPGGIHPVPGPSQPRPSSSFESGALPPSTTTYTIRASPPRRVEFQDLPDYIDKNKHIPHPGPSDLIQPSQELSSVISLPTTTLVPSEINAPSRAAILAAGSSRPPGLRRPSLTSCAVPSSSTLLPPVPPKPPTNAARSTRRNFNDLSLGTIHEVIDNGLIYTKPVPRGVYGETNLPEIDQPLAIPSTRTPPSPRAPPPWRAESRAPDAGPGPPQQRSMAPRPTQHSRNRSDSSIDVPQPTASSPPPIRRSKRPRFVQEEDPEHKRKLLKPEASAPSQLSKSSLTMSTQTPLGAVFPSEMLGPRSRSSGMAYAVGPSQPRSADPATNILRPPPGAPTTTKPSTKATIPHPRQHQMVTDVAQYADGDTVIKSDGILHFPLDESPNQEEERHHLQSMIYPPDTKKNATRSSMKEILEASLSTLIIPANDPDRLACRSDGNLLPRAFGLQELNAVNAFIPFHKLDDPGHDQNEGASGLFYPDPIFCDWLPSAPGRPGFIVCPSSTSHDLHARSGWVVVVQPQGCGPAAWLYAGYYKFCMALRLSTDQFKSLHRLRQEALAAEVLASVSREHIALKAWIAKKKEEDALVTDTGSWDFVLGGSAPSVTLSKQDIIKAFERGVATEPVHRQVLSTT